MNRAKPEIEGKRERLAAAAEREEMLRAAREEDISTLMGLLQNGASPNVVRVGREREKERDIERERERERE